MVRMRYMVKEDYQEIRKLWDAIEGFRIRSLDDSLEGIGRFLERNPKMSIVAEDENNIVGSILCGHDGRTGVFYHVCVDPKFRKKGIGRSMAEMALQSLEREKIGTVTLQALADNETGNLFWERIGWLRRSEVNYYDYILNSKNVIHINSASEGKDVGE